MIDAGVPVLRLIAVAMPALASQIVFTSALRGAGDTRVPVLISWFGFLGVRIPLAFLLAYPAVDLGRLGVIPGANLGLLGRGSRWWSTSGCAVRSSRSASRAGGGSGLWFEAADGSDGSDGSSEDWDRSADAGDGVVGGFGSRGTGGPVGCRRRLLRSLTLPARRVAVLDAGVSPEAAGTAAVQDRPPDRSAAVVCGAGRAPASRSSENLRRMSVRLASAGILLMARMSWVKRLGSPGAQPTTPWAARCTRGASSRGAAGLGELDLPVHALFAEVLLAIGGEFGGGGEEDVLVDAQREQALGGGGEPVAVVGGPFGLALLRTWSACRAWS